MGAVVDPAAARLNKLAGSSCPTGAASPRCTILFRCSTALWISLISSGGTDIGPPSLLFALIDKVGRKCAEFFELGELVLPP
jgi:hypothetical protein